MAIIEANPISRELINFVPSSTELMAGFVIGANGQIPIDEEDLSKGLAAATKQADFLGRFIDVETGKISSAAINALNDLEKQGLIEKEDGNWIVPVSKPDEGVNTAAGQISAKVRSIFKQPGIDVLVLAGQAANDVWSGKSV